MLFGKPVSQTRNPKPWPKIKIREPFQGLVNFIESKLSNPIQDTIDTIDTLKKLNIPVALLTNNWFIENGKKFIKSLICRLIMDYRTGPDTNQ